MNLNQTEDRTIALAGVLQACQQVQSLARSGASNRDAAKSSLKSILVLDALNTPAVFGGLEGVQSGLQLIAQGILNSPDPEKMEILRYSMSLLQLQGQLFRNQDQFDKFAGAIERLSALPEDQLIDGCSSVYQKYISVMRPQIIVQGEQDHLQNADIPDQVRSMLLAGIRAAVLWQQKGGGKFRLLWERTRMQNAAKSLLKSGWVH